jgi:hypothetical protein
MIKDEYRQFLLGPASAGKTRHSGRMLYEHLCGTHKLLEEWGNSENVCTAGLFHSIYGTKRFRYQSWPVKDRGTIQKLIGYEPEQMAWMFCTADRPKAWFVETTEPTEYMRSLREIEAANLIEQGSGSHWLTRLRDSDISEAAKAAVDRHLSARAA